MFLFVAGLLLLDQMVSRIARASAPADFKAAVDAKSGFEPARRFDVWILGDSLAADAFVPEVIERETGLSTFNWGVYASSPVEWELLLRDLDARAPFPRLIVLGANPQMLRKAPGAGPYTREFVRSPALRAELTGLSLLEDDLGAAFASGRSRLLARSALLGLFGRGSKTRVHPRPPDNGYLANTRVLPPTAHPRAMNLGADPRRRRLNTSALRAIKAACQRHGAVLVIAEPPTSARERPMLEGSVAERTAYSKVLDHLANDLFRPNPKEFGDGDFFDGIHLVDPASRRFSEAFSKWLLQSDAWPLPQAGP
ncbi:MAG: hypothetical protein IT207_01895 [Fimbriimonadaceae bacterium]|nr:hypothetical protein [Fimbriimonadaceae bacterium]